MIKKYLRVYVNDDQDNSVDLPLIAELEAYWDWNHSGNIALFLATKRHHLGSDLELPIQSEKSLLSTAGKEIKAANGFMKKIAQLRKHLREDLKLRIVL